MTASRWLLFAQVCIVLALLTSAALYIHYLDPADSALCGMRSGCEAVRRSGIGYFGSRYLSLPLVGFAANALLLALTLWPRPAAPGPPLGHPLLWLFMLSGLGASLGLGLLAYQFFAVKAWCWLCVIVDVSALLTALAAFFVVRAVRLGGEPESPLQSWAWVCIAALAVLAPALWSKLKAPARVPPQVAALYQPGKINVIEFADFQCPYCRKLHATLTPLLAEYGPRVHFVRVQYPLEQHEMAEPAARAALCAAAAGRADAMADELFRIELSEENIAAAARTLGFDPRAFAACTRADATTRALGEQRALLPPEDFKGLPTTFVGTKTFLGAWPEATFRDAFEHAEKPPPWAPSGPLYIGALVLALCAFIVAGRRRPGVLH